MNTYKTMGLRGAVLTFSALLAASAQAETTMLIERLVYINDNLIGYYSACVADEIYLPETFFENVKLRRTGIPLECAGLKYWKPEGVFLRIDAKNMIVGNVRMDDYSSETATYAANSPAPDSAAAIPRKEVSATVLQHNLGVWLDSAGNNVATLGLGARRYSPIGLFSVDGYLASGAKVSGNYISNVSWKRDFNDSGVTGELGLNTLALSGIGVRLYGLVIGTDQEQQTAASMQTIDGFAEVPGRLLIRSHGTLVREVPVSAGYFSIPTASLSQTVGAAGQYNLALVDQLGRTLRTWDVFVPTGAQLLRAGASNWRVLVGQIETDELHRTPISGPRNLGAGFSYRRGVSSALTGEVSSFVGEHDQGAGASFAYVPLNWLSLNAGTLKRWGSGLTSSTYGGVDVHGSRVGVGVNYLIQPCIDQFSVGSGKCSSVRATAHLWEGRLGRLQLLGTKAVGVSPRASSMGLNWSLPSIGGISWSIYGTRELYQGGISLAVGLTASIPLGRGQLSGALNVSDNHTSIFSTTYTVADADNNQYGIGADANRFGDKVGGTLRASVLYSPWYGTYQASGQTNRQGGLAVGFNESGAVLATQGQLMFSKPSDDGFAIVHLKYLGGMRLESGAGAAMGMTNRNGYAALPVTLGSAPLLEVSAEEVSDDIAIQRPLLGKPATRWLATLWQPSVRYVNRGWLRVTFPNGQPLTLGSTLRLGHDDTQVYALAAGSVYIEDLPAQLSQIQVSLPGDVGRCLIAVPANVALRPDYVPDQPALICRPVMINNGNPSVSGEEK